MSSELTRRAALRYVAALMGVGLSAPAILGILDGCSAKKAWRPVFLTTQRGALVAEVAEIIRRNRCGRASVHRGDVARYLCERGSGAIRRPALRSSRSRQESKEVHF